MAAHRERLHGEVGAAAECSERGALGAGHDPGQLAGVAARQLDSHNVGMLSQRENAVGAEIETAARGREVVDQQRYGAGVGDGPKVLQDQLRRQEAAVV